MALATLTPLCKLYLQQMTEEYFGNEEEAWNGLRSHSNAGAKLRISLKRPRYAGAAIDGCLDVSF